MINIFLKKQGKLLCYEWVLNLPCHWVGHCNLFIKFVFNEKQFWAKMVYQSVCLRIFYYIHFLILILLWEVYF